MKQKRKLIEVDDPSSYPDLFPTEKAPEKETLSYNSLVQSWPEILRLSREVAPPPDDDGQIEMFGQD